MKLQSAAIIPFLTAAVVVSFVAPASPANAVGAPVSGVVKDSTGAPVAGASVSLLDPQHVPVASTRSDEAGAFTLRAPSAGSYLLVADSPGLAVRRMAVNVGSSEVTGLNVLLQPAPLSEQVTVTANPGRVEALDSVAQPVNVIGSEDLALRAKSVIAQIGNEEVGLPLQRTSPTMAGIFVRGLTGTKVSVFVDGQRYSTGSARGGVNTFLEPGRPERRSRRRRCCAARAAPSTAATRWAAASSSSRRTPSSAARAAASVQRVATACTAAAPTRGSAATSSATYVVPDASRVMGTRRRPPREHAARGRGHRLAQRGHPLPRA